MTHATLIQRSLRYYWRTHLGVLLGTAVAVAVLVGALLVGDAVRHTLGSIALARLGDVELALGGTDRFFRSRLADELDLPTGAIAAPVLQLRGTVASADRGVRVADVQIFGVDERFWKLGSTDPPMPDGAEDVVAFNAPLAKRLGAAKGAEILLRVHRPESLSRDSAYAPGGPPGRAINATCAAVVSDDAFGRFSLRADQLAPYSVFVPLKWLQRELGREGRANLLLIGGSGGAVTVERAGAALKEAFDLADAELAFRPIPGGSVELRSDRVFLDAAIGRAVVKADVPALGVLTYLATEIRSGERSTPYAMVAGVGYLRRPRDEEAVPTDPAWTLIPEDMPDDAVVVSGALAADDELALATGSRIELNYFVLDPGGGLTDVRGTDRAPGPMTVLAVRPMDDPPDGAAAMAMRDLMPLIPWLGSEPTLKKLELGAFVDREVISRNREKLDAYWSKYRGTPKAFVTLDAARAMWAGRFGDLTAVRVPAAAAGRVEAAIREHLDPADVGLFFQPVRESALGAARSGTDFGTLFLSMSFFLIVAALLLMVLLLVFGIEQRARQTGLLLSVGYRPKEVRSLLMGEAKLLALGGTVLGAFGGVLYARGVLVGLATIWRTAAEGSAIRFHLDIVTVFRAAFIGLLTAMLAMWFAIRRQTRRPARELLAGGATAELDVAAGAAPRGRVARIVAPLSAVAAAGLVAYAATGADAPTGAFFGAGALLLTAGIAASWALLGGRGPRAGGPPRSPAGLALRNASRRPGRSVAVVALLAAGCFLIVSVEAFRQDPLAGAEKPASGTGGWALFARSTLPVYEDLAAPDDLDAYEIDPSALANVRVLPLRVRAGDDASCLNLNRTAQPRIVAVPPEALAKRGAFTFTHPGAKAPWLSLDGRPGDGVLPAVGDEATVRWALGLKVGDELEIRDERGRPVRLRIVGMFRNSILQGSLLVSERAFAEHFPGISGSRMFLIDAPPGRSAAVADALRKRWQDAGLEVTATTDRLARFSRVEMTYLSIFQVLGGLGLLLGSVGLGMVVLRNVLERRAELALLRAVGFTASALRRMVLIEHAGLLVLGLACGSVSAAVAVYPALSRPGAGVPYGSLALLLAAILVSGLLWTYLAAAWSLRGRLLDALRSE